MGELLAAYQLGLLDDPDRVQVEAHLLTCPHCQELAYEDAPVAVCLRARPQEIAAMCRPRRSPQFRPGWRVSIPLAAAAILASLILIGRHVDSHRIEDIARVVPLSYEVIDHRSGAAAAGEREFHAAMEHYVRGDHAAAAAGLDRAVAALDREPAHAPSSRWWPAQLYLGLCRLLEGQTDSALGPLEVAMTAPVRPIADHARWYAAQALLLQRRTAEATALLEEVSTTSSPYAVAARKQLARLEEVERSD